MELIVQVQNGAAATAVLEAGAAGVAVRLPREPAPAWWPEAGAWQAAVRQRHRKFYLVWDRLVREAELPGALKMLEAIARMTPDALVLRDLGLTREARRRFPQLPLHAAGNWGFQNSPGLRLAETLGFSGVVLEAPLGLKDLALLRRQSSMPLTAVLPPFCQRYAGLCLVEEHLGMGCSQCCRPLEQEAPAAVLMAALEMLSGLCQMGVEAVQVRGDFFPEDSLKRALGLYQAVWEAPPSARLRVLAAAREVLATFGDKFMAGPVRKDDLAAKEPPPKTPWRGPSAPQPQPGLVLGRGLVWLEARGYVEAAALAREWRDPILIRLTPENYAAFFAGASTLESPAPHLATAPGHPGIGPLLLPEGPGDPAPGRLQPLCGGGLGRRGPGPGRGRRSLRRPDPGGAKHPGPGGGPPTGGGPGLPAAGPATGRLAALANCRPSGAASGAISIIIRTWRFVPGPPPCRPRRRACGG